MDLNPREYPLWCLWSSVRRQQFQVAAPALLPVATSAGCSSLPCLSTQPAFLTASWRHFTKQQGGRRQAGCFFSLLAASSLSALFFFFFKKHHHTYIDVILVFYGLKMTDSGGVFPVLCVSLPAGNHCPWASVHRQHCAPHPIDTQPHLGWWVFMQQIASQPRPHLVILSCCLKP